MKIECLKYSAKSGDFAEQGKIENLFQAKLESICEDYKNKISTLPFWKIESTLPEEIKVKTLEEKIEYLMDKFKAKNPIY